MKEDIILGRVVGETTDFVDVEFEGHDVRDLLSLHATKCVDMLTQDEVEKIRAAVGILLRGDLSGKTSIIRVGKNVYAFANSKKKPST